MGKIFGFGCLGFLVVMIVAAVMVNRSYRRCAAQVDARVAAPDSSHEAIVYHYECGFGRKGLTNLSIEEPGGDPRYPANLFAAMDSSGMNLVLGTSRRPAVEAVWDSPAELTVRYQAGARVMLQMPASRGVRARYVEQ